MRVLFAGSPDVAVPTLRALAESEHTVVGVITQPPQPVGRKRVLTPTAVGSAAESLGLPVFSPRTNDELLSVVTATAPDIAVVVAYGRILSAPLLESVPGGWWNIHFSLLPRWRGAAPVQRALLEGDTESGITLFRIVEELDAGPIAAQKRFPIAPHDTAGTLLSKLGAEAPALVLGLLGTGQHEPPHVEPQSGNPTYAPKLTPVDAHLDPRDTAVSLYRRFQACTPEPGATLFRSDDHLAIKLRRTWIESEVRGLEPGELKHIGNSLVMGTTDVALVLESVQPAGKREMTGLEWFRGLPAGVMLTGG